MSDPVWQTEKKAGNEAFSSGRMNDAVIAYTKALNDDSLPSNDRATILNNRAQCYLNLNDFTLALEDCTACLTLTPGNVKALYRRAVALEGLKSLKEALEEYKAVLKLSPTLADASKAVNRLSSALGIPLPPKPSSSNSGKQSNTNNSVGGLTEEDARVLEEAEHRVKEVGRQKARTQQQLSMSNAEKRRSELTLSQLGTIPNDRNLYRSVGRLFIKTPKPEIETLLQTAAQKADQKMKVCSSTMEYLQKQEAEADKAFLEVIESIRKKAGRT